MALQEQNASTAEGGINEDDIAKKKYDARLSSISNLPQFIVAFTVNLLYISSKLAMASRARNLEHLSTIENWPWQRHDLIHQTYCASALLSFPLFSVMLQLNSRKLCIFTVSGMYLLYPFLVKKTTCYEAFHFTQLFAAFCVAGTKMVTLVYISEISQANVRAKLLIMSVLMHNLCPNIERLFPFLSHTFLSVLGIIPASIVIVCFQRYFPDTPIYLLRHGKPEATLCSLQWLRNSNNEDEMQREIENMKTTLQSDTSDPKKKIRHLTYFTIIIMMCITENMTGLTATTTELKQILLTLNRKGRYYGNFHLYIYPILGNIAAIVVCKHLQLRKHVLISTLICSITLLANGICYQIIEKETDWRLDKPMWLEKLGVILYSLIWMLSYNEGIGVLTPVVAADILPVNMLNMQFAVIGMISWFFTTLIDAILYQQMKVIYHVFGAFSFYSGICAIGGILIFCALKMRSSQEKRQQKRTKTDNEIMELRDND